MSYTVDPIEAKVYMVRVAEQAELYDDMLNFMEPIVVEKAASMTQDDRTLFGVAAKNYIQQDRRTHRTISVVKTYNQFERYIPLLDEYLDKVIIRLTQKCQRVIDLIDRKVLDIDKENTEIEPEVFAFFWKMKGDFFRYIAEASKDDRQEEAKKEAQTCYGRADDFTIPACSPTKLSIILNYSVFVNEVMGQQEDAIKMTEKILSDALEKIDDLPDDDFKEAKNIIDVLKENLQIWKDNQDRLAGKNPAEN